MDGIINIYKEKGFTSHDVVAKLRGILKQKKIGHTGTLDPDAVGVLPVCLGKATKVCDLLTNKDKTYQAILKLGIVTDTQDMSGKITGQEEVNVSKEEIEAAVYSFVGEYDQIPPMYSALKVNGKKLYELAREGKEIERKARRISIYQIKILEILEKEAEVHFEVSCSKGTYIRTLCYDIGMKLDCGGCMKELIRTKVSQFDIDDSLKLSQVESLLKEDKLEAYILKVEDMFPNMSNLIVGEEFTKLIYNGNKFHVSHVIDSGIISNEEEVKVYDYQGKFIGIYKYLEDGQIYVPVKMFL